MPRTEELKQVLSELLKKCDLDGVAIVTNRGQPVAAILPHDAPEKAVSAMAASILSIGQRVGYELGAGEPRHIIVDGTENTVVLVGFDSMVLVGRAPSTAEIGLIRFEAGKTVRKLQELLS